MKIIILLSFLSLPFFINAQKEIPISKVIHDDLDFSIQQYMRMANVLKSQEGLLPKTFKDGKLVTCASDWWTSGFFPGSLWYLYEYSGNDDVKKMSELFTSRVENQKYTTNNHDVGFMIYCSFGNGYRITANDSYKDVILTASKSLSTRYRPTVGCLRSWDWGKWEFPVIIDNMMNLELLFWSSHFPGCENYYNIAVSHANVTMANHFRPDFSCYHVVSYDTITGKAKIKETRQGFSDASSWARGQAWALYGYTMTYRETKDSRYLKHARNVANFILNHKNLPADKIPYWDFDAPDIPNTFRDSSAGAIICSALIELSQYVGKDTAELYLDVAEKQIRVLSSSKYRASLGGNGNFILMHGVGSIPQLSEIDVPLSYADYYYIEALMRYKKLLKL